MSGRNYLSGAKKRKLAEDKKQKEEETMKKIPKITQMFSVAGPSSAIAGPSSVIVESETERPEETDDENIGSMNIVAENISSVNLNDEEEFFEELMLNASTSSFTIENPPEFRFPTDVALWDVHTELPNLQRYWSKQGRFFVFLIISNLFEAHFSI